MDQLKDIWASMLAHVNERSTNPFTLSFAASWAAWNYRFIVVLFSAESPAKTFAQIDAIYASDWSRWGSGFLAPLLTALAYVYLYPYWTEKVVRFYRARQIAIANAVKLEEGHRLMRPDEVSQIVRLHESDLRAAKEELTASQTRVAQLRDALAIIEAQKKEDPVQASSEETTFEDAAAGESLGDDSEEGLQPSEGPVDITTDRNGNNFHLYKRHLTVLTAITESASTSSQVAEHTLIRKYWVDESLRDLVDLSFAQESSSGYFTATKEGLHYLRTAIAENRWQVPE